MTTDDVTDFFKTLLETSHAIHLFVEKSFFANTDITMIQFGILKQLVLRGGVADTMTDLWCDHHTTRGNLSGIIDRMIESGLVSRREVTSDRRRKQITLTPFGQKKYDEILTLMKKHIPEFIHKTKGIPLPELTTSLKKIRDIHTTTK